MSRVPDQRYSIRPHGEKFAVYDRQLDAAVYIGSYEECARRRLLVSLEHREDKSRNEIAYAVGIRRIRARCHPH